MTTSNSQNQKYNAGDVPEGRRFHENTAHKADDAPSNSGRFLLESKERPMLIIGTPRTRIQEYTTLDFTSHEPKDQEKPDYLLKENGTPRSFGPMLGFKRTSYLKIYPIRSCPENMLRESKIDSFPREFVDSVITIARQRLGMDKTQGT